jgi:hypothetical protein
MALLLPLANVFYGAFLTDPAEQKTEAFLREQVACAEGAVISLTIDGVPVVNPERYFERSTLFSVQLPADNVFGVDESIGPRPPAHPKRGRRVLRHHQAAPAGHPHHSPGHHRRRFVPQDVTYTITVTPGK